MADLTEPADDITLAFARNLMADRRFQALTKGERLALLSIALLYTDAEGYFIDLSSFESDTGLPIAVFQGACPTVFETGLLAAMPVATNTSVIQFDPALLP